LSARIFGSKHDGKSKKTRPKACSANAVDRLTEHLEPLALAANITQGNAARLDIVVLTLATLWRIFTKPDKFDEDIQNAVLASVKKRWADTDQEVGILAVILNPYVRTSAFHPRSKFCDLNDKYQLFEKVHRRLVDPSGPPTNTRLAWCAYLERRERFSSTNMLLEEAIHEADSLVR
jgi:hypothetical protein